MSRIANVKKKQPFDVYCGRANSFYGLPQSKWANPFVIGKDGTRPEVIELHRLWINSQPDLLQALPELKGKVLGCWCDYPAEECHCATLIEQSDSKYVMNWFSNMIPFNEVFVYQGIKYRTPENFYQAMKMPKDRVDLRAEIAEMLPHQAKTAIRNKVRYPWRPDWNKELALKAMRMALNHKFAIGTTWNRKLMLAWDWEIVEWNNWGDTYWGKDIRTREGENHLGRMLMEIREVNNKIA